MGNYKEIPLTKGYTAIVDAEDFERFGHLNWSATEAEPGRFYAHRKVVTDGKICTIYLHRAILNAPRGTIVDHKDGNTLDCRLANLRIATPSQNCWNHRRRRNAAGFIGVHRNYLSGSYYGRVNALRKTHQTSTFQCPILAAAARDVLAQKLHGDFARLNFKFIPLQQPTL